MHMRSRARVCVCVCVCKLVASRYNSAVQRLTQAMQQRSPRSRKSKIFSHTYITLWWQAILFYIM